MLQKRESTILTNIRFCFTILYIVMFSFYNLLPYKILVNCSDAVIYAMIPVIGLILLVADVLYKQNLFKIPYADILILFFIVYFVSVILNFKYGYIDNFKGMLWMCIQVFALCGLDPTVDKDTHLKHFRILSNIYIFIYLIGFVWSFVQYVIGYGGYCEVFIDEKMTYRRIGFIEARLFGVFTDPNYACISALISAGLIFFNLKAFKCNIGLKVYYIFALIMQIFYAILSGSRTGLLIVMLIGFAVGGFLITAQMKRKSVILKIISFCLSGVICMAVVFGCYQGIKKCLSYIPSAYSIVVKSDETSENNFVSPPVDFNREDVDINNFSNNRFSIWKDSIEIIKKSPLFGTGPRSYLAFAEEHFDDLYIVEKQYSVHNGYLALFVGTGIIGGGLMLFWLVRVVILVISYLVRRWNNKDEFYWPIFSCTLVLFVEAISAFPLMALFFCNQSSDIIFWIVLGFTLLFLRKSEPERYEKQSITGRIFSFLSLKKYNKDVV